MTGPVDELILRRQLRAWNAEAARFSALKELVDCREMECAGCRTVHEVVEVGTLERGQPWATNGHLVIVVSQPVVYGMARAYLAGVEGVRKDVHVTYSMDEALTLLDVSRDLLDSLSAQVVDPSVH